MFQVSFAMRQLIGQSYCKWCKDRLWGSLAAGRQGYQRYIPSRSNKSCWPFKFMIKGQALYSNAFLPSLLSAGTIKYNRWERNKDWSKMKNRPSIQLHKWRKKNKDFKTGTLKEGENQDGCHDDKKNPTSFTHTSTHTYMYNFIFTMYVQTGGF